ncbi:hypothetical protein KFL_000850230 [Klebsormidium nitens]|uniref:RecQ-mediated genome instability protein 1 n=1 Tax=Klebsormidium nitens TaxID=105231 RepID=A0A1Y1HYJ1_KLENI|nr:hypothetical protein KFL_000850230 [Klebsormidium nitens]|eukprot:GAQ81607.1 hypothetical protein KFL_000850230 [Klebsormidium nitens]
MNMAALGRLPPDVTMLHKEELRGRYVLQVDEAADVGCAPQNRYKEHPSSCLKLSLTDGEQRAYAIEYRKVPQLSPMMPAGIKIAVSNVFVRQGLLLLCPENVVVLGGKVQCLEEARQRVMERWNQPPRGRRTPLNQGAVPTNYRDAAAAAAWPPQANPPPNETENGPAPGSRVHPTNGWAPPQPAATFRAAGECSQPAQPSPHVIPLQGRAHSSKPLPNQWQEPPFASDAAPWPRSGQQETAPGSPERARRPKRTQADRPPDVGLDLDTDDEEEQPLRVARRTASRPRARALSEDEDEELPAASPERPFRFSAEPVRPPFVDETLGPLGTKRQSVPKQSTPRVAAVRMSDGGRPSFGVASTPPPARSAEVIDLASPEMDVENDEVVAVAPLAPESNSSPFSYLKHVLRQKAALPPGGCFEARVKCILVGVTRFDFKSGSSFATRVHIDDGSAMCECMIASEAVEELVGHTAPVVSAALSSKDAEEKEAMRAKMKRVQHFFTTFEGTMDLQVDERYQLPNVVKLQSGISDEDGWKLLRRLQNTG